MSTLTNKQIRNTYDSLLKLEDNDGLDSSLKKVTDGLGIETPLSLSETEVKSSVVIEAEGLRTPTGTAAGFLKADGSVDTNTYLTTGDKNYVHDQGVPSATWTVNHGLNKFCNVVVVDSAKSVVAGTIDYTDLNNVVLTFNAGFSGYAYFN